MLACHIHMSHTHYCPAHMPSRVHWCDVALLLHMLSFCRVFFWGGDLTEFPATGRPLHDNSEARLQRVIETYFHDSAMADMPGSSFNPAPQPPARALAPTDAAAFSGAPRTWDDGGLGAVLGTDDGFRCGNQPNRTSCACWSHNHNNINYHLQHVDTSAAIFLIPCNLCHIIADPTFCANMLSVPTCYLS